MTDRPANPEDNEKQALRLRRWMMAAGASAIVVAVFFAAHLLDLLDRRTFWTASLVTLGFVVAFYVMFRSGLNLRYRDPSLTMPQILAASLVLLYTVSQSKEGHGVLALLFLMPFLFGVFRLRTRQLLGLTAFVSISYALIIYLKWGFQSEADPDSFHVKILNWFVSTFVLAFFAVMGGYISKLRKDLTANKERLESALSRIESMAARDYLTGVFNRRSLFDIVQQQKNRADRHGTTFSVLMIDIDHFKRVNDSYGHQAGDAVLKKFADAAGATLRGVDVFGRYGGEEFMVILEQASLDLAGAIAARICELARNLAFDQRPGGPSITVSIGCAEYRKPEPWEQTVERADKALYRAKEKGRNRVETQSAPARNGPQDRVLRT
jgi:diguanylate cyclase (GGDEF)-like protein